MKTDSSKPGRAGGGPAQPVSRDSSLLLLDVNVLVAIAWPNHQFHATAVRRMESSEDRWATCALTQLGFIRLSSNPAAVSSAKSPGEAVALLALMTSDHLHTYLEALPSPLEKDTGARFDRILGSKQVTDAYLLALAHRNDAIFLTFDTRLKTLAGHGIKTEVLGID
ncbi:MAG: TA system VapC family ribonuclease toxin [Bryobacteraceae bacterium]